MDLKQIILTFGAFFVAACSASCYSEEDLTERAKQKLKHFPQPWEPTAGVDPTSPYSCPVEQFSQEPLESYKDRSLSPWRYVLVKDETLFPPSYAQAQCLCKGCILIQGMNDPRESSDYVSVPLVQSRKFLKRESCGNNTYRLTPVNVNVAVGCTCVRHKSS